MTSPSLDTLDCGRAIDIFDEIQRVYAEAFPGHDLGDHRRRTLRQARSPGFAAVTARLGSDLVGVASGLPLGAASTWWEGLNPPGGPEFFIETGGRTFAVIDLAVVPAVQGQGIGRQLMDTLLRSRGEARATLAAEPHKAGNKNMYERWGWRLVGQVPGRFGDHATGV